MQPKAHMLKQKESEEVALRPGAGSTKHQLAATPAARTHKVKLLFSSQQAPQSSPTAGTGGGGECGRGVDN